ncbi:O-antigen ligase family protein [Desulfobacterales bacterium HSG16]|nr:O-antigen ligase family protein [Desulfobacterales bacterium HSG16]
MFELKKKTNWLEKSVFILTAALLIFAPLSFGSIHVWAYTILEVGVFTSLFLLAVERLLISDKPCVEWIKTPATPFLAAMLILTGLQALPLPPWLVSIISPNTYHDKIQLYQIINHASDLGQGKSGFFSLAYYLHPMIKGWLKMAAYVGMFFLVLHQMKSKKRINYLIYVIVGTGFFQGIYGILFQMMTNKPMVWWWNRVSGFPGSVSGTFIGSNNYAFYMEIIVFTGMGFMIAQHRHQGRLLSGLGGIKAYVQHVVSWLSPESSNPKIIFMFIGNLFLMVALILSRSRGGILAFICGMLLTGLLFFLKSRFRILGVISLFLCFIIVMFGINIGSAPVSEKFKNIEGLNRRLHMSSTMIPMLLDYPVSGVGWRNFRFLYTRYDPPDFDGVSDSGGYSHNDWLEAATEAGILGGVLLLCAAAVYFFSLFRVWRKRNDMYALGIGIGVMACLCAISFHSFFDLSMHIPANPLTLAAVMAIGYAAVYRQEKGIEEVFFYRVLKFKLAWAGRISLTSILLGCLVLICYPAIGHLSAEFLCSTEYNPTMNLKTNTNLVDIKKAVSLNSGNAEYHFRLARYFIDSQTQDQNIRYEFDKRAIQSLQKAVTLNPARGIYWYNLGNMYSKQSKDNTRYLFKWLPLADLCFDMALKNMPYDAYVHANIARYWVWRSTLLPKKQGNREKDSVVQPVFDRTEGIRKFTALYRKALSLRPDKWQRAAVNVWEYYPDDAIVYRIAPENNEKVGKKILQWLVNRN